jgi:hypothetical protein
VVVEVKLDIVQHLKELEVQVVEDMERTSISSSWGYR